MIMITGGAFQGKTDYAKERFSLSDNDIIDCGKCSFEAMTNAVCLRNYELAVKRMYEAGMDPIAAAKELEAGIVIMTEIGSGIIPLEKNEREWRELTGRAGCVIAERSTEVIRLCCGLPQKIKGDKI